MPAALESAVTSTFVVVYLLAVSSCWGTPAPRALTASSQTLAELQCPEGEYRKFKSCLPCTKCSDMGLSTYSDCSPTKNTVCSACPLKGNVDSTKGSKRCLPLEETDLPLFPALTASTVSGTKAHPKLTDTDIDLGYSIYVDSKLMAAALLFFFSFVLLTAMILMCACRKNGASFINSGGKKEMEMGGDHKILLSGEFFPKLGRVLQNQVSHSCGYGGKAGNTPHYIILDSPEKKQHDHTHPSYMAAIKTV